MTSREVRTDGGIETETDLDGQVAVVSGGTDGIGKATATALAERGATTALVGSTPEKGQAAASDIAAEADTDAVDYHQADLSRMAEVQRLADEIRAEYDRLDVLVHTAGIVPTEQEMTDEGIERSFAINYLSRFALTTLLDDRLRAGGPTRVVDVAYAGQHDVDKLDLEDLAGDRLFADPAEGDHNVRGELALAQAQVANDLFAVELAERLDGEDVSVTVVNPGAVDTDIRLKAGGGWEQVDEMLREEYGVVSPAEVAETILPLATVTETATTNGRFYGPQGEIDHQDGVDDSDLRAGLWERSEQLASQTKQV